MEKRVCVKCNQEKPITDFGKLIVLCNDCVNEIIIEGENYKKIQRRQLIEDSVCDFDKKEWEEIKRKQNYTCLYCGKQEPEIKLTIDHIIPLIKGGDHTASNIQGLCLKCNLKKGAKLLDPVNSDLIIK